MAIRLWQALDADGNVIDRWTGPQKISRIGTEWNGATVAQIVEDRPEISPQEERSLVFARTLDKMNPIWYNALSDAQRAELATWRQAWLDFPETGVRPDDLTWLQA